MFLEPSINDQKFTKDATNLNWPATIQILRTSFLDIHPSVLEEAKKHLPTNISSIEEKLILNGGRGILKTHNNNKLFAYAKLVDKKTIFIVTTFNRSHEWASKAKKILNLSKKDININFGTDPKCGNAEYTRSPLPGYRVYITDVNGLNRMVSKDFFSGELFGNEIDFMIIDRFFQTLSMIPDAISKEIHSIAYIDEVYISQNYESMGCLETIAWTEEQTSALKEIGKLSGTTIDPKIIDILKEVDFILS